MSSRRLWLLLLVLAVPLMLEAVTGCQLIFPLEHVPPVTNAYTCECSCNAGTRERTKTVSVRADDADQRRSDGSMTLGNNDLRMNDTFLVGVRFATLGLPQGATIQTATVQFTATQADAAGPTIAISIEDADDAAAFTTNTNDISGRTYAALPPVNWSPNAWTAGTRGPDQLTSDLATLVQAVVIRGGWTTNSSLVLKFDATGAGHLARSFDGSAANAPTLRVTYIDPAETVTTKIPVCAEFGATDTEADADHNGLPDVPDADCANRVENTYKGLIGACGYITDATSNCGCHLIESGFTDKDESGTEDVGEAYFGYPREICDVDCVEQPLNLPPDPNDPQRCSNFDPKGFAACVDERLAFCAQNAIQPADCNINDCLPFIAATNAPGDDPVCVAHASAAPQPVAFQLFGRRSTCEVVGRSEILVGDDQREPKKEPLTRGIIELFGGPCPGRSCVVGISSQLAMNPITFDIKWHSDPTFSDLTQAGNSVLTAAALDSAGAGALPAESSIATGHGRRGSNREALAGRNGSPLGLVVNWAAFTCSLDGNLLSTVDAEDPQGVCDGDHVTVCRNDSPDCDDAGGPCNLPSDDAEPFVVNVALEGALLNQPPTANAGADQTRECTSPAGAAFLLDGSQSFDPDGGGDIRIVSWRSDRRTGPEIGFDRTIATSLGVGQGKTYVLRVIDSFAQADEDATAARVVDTTPPDVFCNAPPTITPPGTPYTFTATATDLCTATVITPQLTSFECFKFNGAGKRLDTTKSCKVTLDHAKITIRNSEGVGNHIAWNARAADATGNVREVRCEVEVVNPGK